MIQHSSGLLKTLELVIKWVVLLMSLITLGSAVLAVCRSSKYEAKHGTRKKEASEESLISALDVFINAINLLLGRWYKQTAYFGQRASAWRRGYQEEIRVISSWKYWVLAISKGIETKRGVNSIRLHPTFKTFYASMVFKCNWQVFYFFKYDFTKQKSTWGRLIKVLCFMTV